MRAIKFMVSLVLSLFLLINLILVQFSFFTRQKLLDPAFYLGTFEKYRLYTYITQSIQTKLSDIGHYANLPQAIFENIVDEGGVKTQVEFQTRKAFEYMLFKTDSPPDTAEINIQQQADKFNANLSVFLKDSNTRMDQATENELNKIKSQVGNLVRNEGTFLNLKGIAGQSWFQTIRKDLYYLYSSAHYLIGLILINLCLLLLLHRRDFSRFCYWVNRTFFTVGFLTCITAVAGIRSKFIDDIAISEPTLKNIVIFIVNASLKFFAESGALVILLGLLFLVLQLLSQRKAVNPGQIIPRGKTNLGLRS